MKQQYTITTGEYDDYYIEAVVEGDASADMDALYAQFKALFGAKRGETWSARLDEVRANLRAAGYPEDTAEAFVEWLCKEHGFTVLPNNERWVSELIGVWDGDKWNTE